MNADKQEHNSELDIGNCVRALFVAGLMTLVGTYLISYGCKEIKRNRLYPIAIEIALKYEQGQDNTEKIDRMCEKMGVDPLKLYTGEEEITLSQLEKYIKSYS